MIRNLVVGFVSIGILLAVSLLQHGDVIGYFPDTYVSIWSIWHAARESLYSSKWIYSPSGSSLLLHNLAEFITVPFSFLVGILALPTIYNLLVFSALFLNFLTAELLLGRVSESKNIRLLGALVLALHPFILGHVGGGHINLFATFPLYFLIYLALDKSPSILALALAFFAVTLTDYYQMWVATISLLAIVIADRSKQVALGLVVGVAVSLIKVFPALVQITSGEYSPNHNPTLHSLPLEALFTRHTSQLLSSEHPFPLNWAETGAYIGPIGVLGFALALKDSSRRFAFAAIVFIALALGPGFYLYDLLASTAVAPPVPARFFLGALVFLTLGIAKVFSHSRNSFLKVTFGTLLLIDFAPKTLPTLLLPHPITIQFSGVVGLDSMGKPLLDLTGPEQAMFNQTIIERPIVNGFLARRPKLAERRVRHLVKNVRQFCLYPSENNYLVMQERLLHSGVGGLVLDQLGKDGFDLPDQCANKIHQASLLWSRSTTKNSLTVQPPA